MTTVILHVHVTYTDHLILDTVFVYFFNVKISWHSLQVTGEKRCFCWSMKKFNAEKLVSFFSLTSLETSIGVWRMFFITMKLTNSWFLTGPYAVLCSNFLQTLKIRYCLLTGHQSHCRENWGFQWHLDINNKTAHSFVKVFHSGCCHIFCLKDKLIVNSVIDGL